MELAKFMLDDITDNTVPHSIKNFIISDSGSPLTSYRLPIEYPFIIDGVIIAICSKGEARIRVNFIEYDIRKNSIMIIMPHFVSELMSKSDDLVIDFVMFSRDFISDIPTPADFDTSKRIIQEPCITLSEEEWLVLLDFHTFMAKQYKRDERPFRTEQLQCLLYAMLTEVSSIYSKRGYNSERLGSTHQEDIMYRFFKLLLEHHRSERSLTFYADKMCLTPKYLSTVVKRTSQRTAFAWINDAIISSAKYMLKTTRLTILQVSEELSFPNPSFFGRFFKKYTGMTPLQYRSK